MNLNQAISQLSSVFTQNRTTKIREDWKDESI